MTKLEELKAASNAAYDAYDVLRIAAEAAYDVAVKSTANSLAAVSIADAVTAGKATDSAYAAYTNTHAIYRDELKITKENK